MSQDGLASFEPAFADELAQIMDWSFDYLQRDGKGGSWERDTGGGSVYLRLSTRPMAQPQRQMTETLRDGIIDGAYWMREPGPNAEVVIAYQGVTAPAAIEAAGIIGSDRRDIGVMAITSADRLNAGWTAAQRARRHGDMTAESHIERMLAQLPPHCLLVTVIDGHPATLGWLGGVVGHRTVPLGVEHFGQTGTVSDLHRHFEIDAAAIVQTVDRLTPGRRLAARLVHG